MKMTELHFDDYSIYEQNMWFSAIEINALCKKNLQTNEIKIVSPIPNEGASRALHIGILNYKDKLVLIPHLAKYVSIYNISNNSFSQLEISRHIYNGIHPGWYDFKLFGLFGNCLFLLSSLTAQIIKINLDSLQFYIIPISEFARRSINYNYCNKIFTDDIVIKDSRFYTPILKTNMVMEFNMENSEYCFHRIGHDTCRLSSIASMKNNNDIYLIDTDENKILRWNIKDKKGYIDSTLETDCGDKLDIFCSVILNNKLAIINRFSDYITIYNINTKTYKKVLIAETNPSEYNRFTYANGSYSKYRVFKKNANIIYLYSMVSEKYLFSNDGDSYNNININFEVCWDEYVKNHMDTIRENGNTYTEYTKDSLGFLIEEIKKRRKNIKNIASNVNYGKSIYISTRL